MASKAHANHLASGNRAAIAHFGSVSAACGGKSSTHLAGSETGSRGGKAASSCASFKGRMEARHEFRGILPEFRSQGDAEDVLVVGRRI